MTELLNATPASDINIDVVEETQNSDNSKQTLDNSSFSSDTQISKEEVLDVDEDEELRRLLVPKLEDLPLNPPSAIQSNFVTYYAPDFTKGGHDQYVHRHANGLCVVGLAPTHLAFKDDGQIISVDFNVGKTDRSGIKVTGKRKKNAQHFESNTALCKAITKDSSYIVRCCVKGSLLEVNERLMQQPGLLNTSADREGYIAILMPKPGDWRKVEGSFIGLDEYRKLRKL